jgi:sugar O-acyltransferase (sialic acid O-acetyltransferase NeuD family)
MKIGVIGAGGQARVISEILSYSNDMQILAYIDQPTNKIHEEIAGIPVKGKRLGDPEVIAGLIDEGMEGFILAVGDNQKRSDLFLDCQKRGLIPVNAIHPTARIATDATIGNGVVVAIGAIICSRARIGNDVIVNSGVIIDHECVIEDHTHLAPGTILAGRVVIQSGAFIGAGSVIKDKIVIGRNALIGAGSVVLENIPDNTVAVGSPAKIVRTIDP